MKRQEWLSRTALKVVIVTILNAALQSVAAAQAWPARPVTMVYPFAAGSGGDDVGRILALHLSQILDQPVVYENAGGAGGMTGTSRVAKAPADGYQLLFTGTSHVVTQTLHKNPLYRTTDFTPVALIAEQPLVLIARKDLPANNLVEFIAYAKANQEKLHYGSPGIGSVAHLACALINSKIGINVTHVPYRGGGAAMQDLIAGRIDYQCPILAVARQQIESQTIRAIAILSKDRSPILPDLASAHEQGMSNFEVNQWLAFYLPKATPAPIVRQLHEATLAAIELPSVRERLKVIGATIIAPERRSPEYLENFTKDEVEKWSSVAKSIGIQAE
jgi:tripartite-type tricarboxylate transporter receptor subunit TctC